ncbi:glycosyltransferase family 25 protein [Actibacterium sp. D379-3]
MTSPSLSPWPIIILTLPGDDARRQPLLDRLDAEGLPYELFFGVDGRRGLPEQYRDQVSDEPHWVIDRSLTDGEYACALSHQAVYRHIVENDLPGAVILEDDALLTDHFRHFMANQIYRKAEFIMLDHGKARVMNRPPKKLMPGVVGMQLALPALYATGYSLSSRAARFMRKNAFPIRLPADWWPCDITRIGALAAMPRIVNHLPDGNPLSHLDEARQITEQARPLTEHSRRKRRRVRYRYRNYWRRAWRKRCSHMLDYGPEGP